MFRIGSGVTGLTGMCLEVDLATRASRGVRIDEIEIRGKSPDLEFEFELLAPPARKGEPYQFTGGFQLQWQDVLNRRVPGVVYRNNPWSGYLLLWSMQSIPADWHKPILVCVDIWDNFDKIGSDSFHVMVDPTTHCETARDPQAGSRPSLFTPIEDLPTRSDPRQYDELLSPRRSEASDVPHSPSQISNPRRRER
jgi:hypothetical protein